jgi:hypothetical protein
MKDTKMKRVGLFAGPCTMYITKDCVRTHIARVPLSAGLHLEKQWDFLDRKPCGWPRGQRQTQAWYAVGVMEGNAAASLCAHHCPIYPHAFCLHFTVGHYYIPSLLPLAHPVQDSVFFLDIQYIAHWFHTDIWLSNFSILNFLVYEENFLFFFISAAMFKKYSNLQFTVPNPSTCLYFYTCPCTETLAVSME